MKGFLTMTPFNFIHGRTFQAQLLTWSVLISFAPPVLGEVFPVELLVEEAQLTNRIGGPVAVSGDWLVVGSDSDFAENYGFSLFKRENGSWQHQGDLDHPPGRGNFGASVALDGTTLIVGDPSNFDGERAYVFTPSTVPALNAWNMASSYSSGDYYYGHAPTPNELALAASEGWTLTVHSRLVTDFELDSDPSSFVDFALTSSNRFLISFSLDYNGGLKAHLNGSVPTFLPTDGLSWLRYHTHQLVYDPTNNAADYFFDGVKMNASPLSPIPAAGAEGVRFGNDSTTGTGSMNFNRVELETRQTHEVLALYEAGAAGNPAVAPDPVTQGWTLLTDNTGPDISLGPVSPDFATAWTVEAILTPTGTGGFFAQSLAVQGDTAVVGASFESGGLDLSGAVYVFTRNGTNWTQQQKLLPSVRAVNDWFGAAVALDADTLVAGAPHSPGTTATGSAFVFVRNGTNWTEQARLIASDAAADDEFGTSVAVDGDRIAVGAQYDNHANAYSGSVYLFDRNGSSWSQQGKFFPNDYPSGESFGEQVALKGDVAVSSGFYYDRGYVFANSSTGWVQAATFVYTNSSDPSVKDVAVDGPTIVISEGQTEGSEGGIHVYRPSYSNATAVAGFVSKLLYYPDAAASAIRDKDQAAFRYKHLLYSQDTNGLVRPDFERMPSLYGSAERDRARLAEAELAKGLALNPNDPTLGNLLLDIYYDRTVAETVLAKSLGVQAEVARFGPPLAPPASANGLIIDNEIPLYRTMLSTNRFALQGYFSLLSNDLGVPGDPPRGYQIFRDLVPTRELMAATYTNESGVSVPVTTNAVLFSGYKDLVLLFDLLRDHGRSAETLARLLISRNITGDRDEAGMVISDAERFLFLQGALLKDMFPTLPPDDDPSGLAAAIGGWRQSLNALAILNQILAGGANALGFADDFMMYVQKFTGQTEHFDSYDSFRVRLDPNTGSNPLRSAKEALQDALDSYASYRGYQDQLAAQFDNSSITYRDRLRDIVGVFPEDPDYSDDPTANPGSELDQQYRSIELARLRIQRNQTEINNLAEEVEIEISRSAAVSEAVVRYSGMQAELTKEIGHIKAAQAAASALADAFSPEKLFTRGIVVGVLNAAAQAGAEEGIAHLEAQKERLAADEQAELDGIESEARVKTLMLGMRTLAVDSQEAALLMTQELNRLVALYREKEDLEQKVAQQDASIASRFFADPVHRLASQADMVTANLAFNEAQKWLYFMVRALEYKWNTPFRNYSHAGRTWSADTIFKLRNATELEQMFEAMDSFENQIQLPKDDYFDWFSVRDDFFGYKRTNNLGQALFYTDPVTGATVDAITAFRGRLSQLQDAQGNIALNFSTVTEIPGGTFFRGPRFNAQGQVISKGLFLDKIRWLKISLPGSHTLGRSQLTGELRYGGTGFIRNFDVGTFDPMRPDRLRNELTAYATRFWFFHAPSATWRFSEALSSPVTMQLSDDPRVPPSVQELDVFKERSVATTGWVLTIPTEDGGQPVLNIHELDDVEIYFFHYAVTRP
jgi:hypothetical protein